MQFTLIRSEQPAILTKRIERGKNGALKKIVHGHLTKGRATTEIVSDMEEFADFLSRLRPNEALIYGIMSADAGIATVVTRDAYDKLSALKRAGMVTRSNDHFAWGRGPGILQIDVDGRPDGTVPPPQEFLEIIDAHLPEAHGVPRAVIPSASSHIHDAGTGEDLTGLRGYRVYLAVDDAATIPGVARIFDARLKAAGHGHVSISKNGQMRAKSLIDMAVYTPCHMDFASGAATGPGLEQRRGAATVYHAGGAPLRGSEVTVSPEVEARAAEAIQTLRTEAAPEAARIASAWRAERIGALTAAGTDPVEAACTVARVERGELAGDYLIQVIDSATGKARSVTVSAILAEPAYYEGCLTLDPVEPDYDGRRAVGRLLLKGRVPRLNSFARGGTTYALLPEAGAVAPGLREILIHEGRTADAVNETVTALTTTGRHYNKGSALVEVSDGTESAWNSDLCAFRLGHLIDYTWETRVRGEIQIQRTDPTPKLVRQLLAHPCRNLPQLVACIDRPLFRPDGTMVTEPGYDQATGLYLKRGAAEFSAFVPSPDEAEIARAIETCLSPFAAFDLRPLGLTAVLAAILTAVVRPVLDMAPMILVRSPDIGAGKTLMTTALAVIAQGRLPSTQTMPDSKAELRKCLLSLLLAGTDVIHLDNTDGLLRSDVLAAFATSPLWSDRELGRSSMRQELPNRCLILANGCNAVTANGLARRVIPIEIAPSDRGSMLRSYDFCPVERAMIMRDDIVGAALTLIGAVPTEFAAAGTVASYRQWDHMVRRTVAWLARQDARLADPLLLFREEIAADAEQDGRRGLLDFLGQLMEEGMPTTFMAVDIVKTADATGLTRVLEEHLNAVSASATTMSPRSVGSILSNFRDQHIHGLRLRGDMRKGRTVWRIEETEAESNSHRTTLQSAL